MQNQPKKLKALVCGASQGIGAATVQHLAQAGVQVFALARSQNKLEELVRSLPGGASSEPVGHRAIVQDLSDLAGLKKQMAQLIQEEGPIHILVNNSGGPKAGPLLEADDSEFLKGFTEHVIVSQNLAKLFVPGMKAENYGRIINIISTSVKVPIPNLGVSNTIRAAMGSWAKTLSGELGSFGITVNNILPGFTTTPRLESLRKATAEKLKTSEAEVEKLWKGQTPTGRFCTPEEVAAAVGFLAIGPSSSITGINLPVDGGRTPVL